MSLPGILKNVYTFVDILQASHSQAVAGWDNEALDRALQWAKYCQQIHDQSCGKQYEGELSEQIDKLASLPWSLGNHTVGLPLLQHATDTLCTVLMQNRHLPDKLFEALLIKTCQNDSGDISENFIKKYSILSQAKSGALLSQAIHQHLHPAACQLPLAMEVLQTYATLVLEHISTVLDHIQHDKRHRSEKLLRKKLHKIWDGKHGKDIILLSLTMYSPDCTRFVTGRSFILNTVQGWIGGDNIRSKELWSCNGWLLAHVAATHSSFTQHYITSLTECGDLLQPHYPHTAKIPTVQWRVEDPSHMSYADLLERWRHLFSVESHTEGYIHTSLATLATRNICNVWRQISRDIGIQLAL